MPSASHKKEFDLVFSTLRRDVKGKKKEKSTATMHSKEGKENFFFFFYNAAKIILIEIVKDI